MLWCDDVGFVIRSGMGTWWKKVRKPGMQHVLVSGSREQSRNSHECGVSLSGLEGEITFMFAFAFKDRIETTVQTAHVLRFVSMSCTV